MIFYNNSSVVRTQQYAALRNGRLHMFYNLKCIAFSTTIYRQCVDGLYIKWGRVTFMPFSLNKPCISSPNIVTAEPHSKARLVEDEMS